MDSPTLIFLTILWITIAIIALGWMFYCLSHGYLKLFQTLYTTYIDMLLQNDDRYAQLLADTQSQLVALHRDVKLLRQPAPAPTKRGKPTEKLPAVMLSSQPQEQPVS